MVRSLLAGTRHALRAWRLAFVLWAASVPFAFVAAFPAFRWWNRSLSYSTGSDALLGGLRVGALAELTHADASAWLVLGATLTAALVLARVARAFVVGGVLHSVARRERTLQGFFAGGALHLPGALALLVACTVAGAIAGGVLWALGRAVVAPLAETPAEALAWVHLVLPLALGLFGLWFFEIVFDYAAARRIVAEDRRFLAAWGAAMAFVARHLVAAAAIRAAMAILLATCAAAYLGLRAAVPAATWPGIVAMFVLQQAFVLARGGLRVATLSAELEYASRAGLLARPEPPPEPVPAPEPAYAEDLS